MCLHYDLDWNWRVVAPVLPLRAFERCLELSLLTLRNSDPARRHPSVADLRIALGHRLPEIVERPTLLGEVQG